MILAGEYGSSFVTNGTIVYFYDKNALKIKELDIQTGVVTELCSVYNNVELVEFYVDDDFYEEGRIAGYCDGYLYFEEWYAPATFVNFIFDVKTKSYQKMKSSEDFFDIGCFYNGKVYYCAVREQLVPISVYEANIDGSDEKVLIENVITFDIIGNTLYYTTQNSKYYPDGANTTIKAYNLDTKQTTTVKNVVCDSTVYFMPLGYGYHLENSDPYETHIEMYDGGELTVKGNIWIANDTSVIFREADKFGRWSDLNRYTIICDGKTSEPIDIDVDHNVIGYFGGRLYYRTQKFDGTSWQQTVRSVTPKFE